tara:strand:+ start:1733 stop:2716 length:984 start_codon:yes stop_codon:yes gene_type:complete
LIPHLKVETENAEKTRSVLELSGNLNKNFRPIKEEGYILWPVTEDTTGDIIFRSGIPSKDSSGDYRSLLPKEIAILAPRAFDVLGHVAIISPEDSFSDFIPEISKALLTKHKNIKTVATDGGVGGDFRVRDLKYVSGDENFVVLHKENNFIFEFDISEVYFSPRLSFERSLVLNQAKINESVLDMFTGVGPFSIYLSKKASHITAIDANPLAKKWFFNNIRKNKIDEAKFTFIEGFAEDAAPTLTSKFDRIIMNHPTSSLNYLDISKNLLKDQGVINFYLIADRLKEEPTPNLPFMESPHWLIKDSRVVHAYSPSKELRTYELYLSD